MQEVAHELHVLYLAPAQLDRAQVLLRRVAQQPLSDERRRGARVEEEIRQLHALPVLPPQLDGRLGCGRVQRRGALRVPRNPVEVELIERGERPQEVQHVARRREAHLEEEQRAYPREALHERLPRLRPERVPAHAREPERRRVDEQVHERAHVVDPRVVLDRAARGVDALVVRADSQAAHAPRDDGRALEEGGEARALVRVLDAHGAEEVQAARPDPAAARQCARGERLGVVPEVVDRLVVELGREEGGGVHRVSVAGPTWGPWSASDMVCGVCGRWARTYLRWCEGDEKGLVYDSGVLLGPPVCLSPCLALVKHGDMV